MVLLPCSKCCGPCWRCYGKEQSECCQTDAQGAGFHYAELIESGAIPPGDSSGLSLTTDGKLQLLSMLTRTENLAGCKAARAEFGVGGVGISGKGITVNINWLDGSPPDWKGPFVYLRYFGSRGNNNGFAYETWITKATFAGTTITGGEGCTGITFFPNAKCNVPSNQVYPPSTIGNDPQKYEIQSIIPTDSFTGLVEVEWLFQTRERDPNIPNSDFVITSEDTGTFSFEWDQVVEMAACLPCGEDPDKPVDYKCFDAPPDEEGWEPVGKCHPTEEECAKSCGPSTNCDSLCSSTFSKRNNQLVDFNGPHSGGYLFQSALPAGWPDGNVLQYNRELIVEVNGEILDEWIVESYYDTFLGVYSYGLLPTKYPRVPDPTGNDVLGRTRSPVRIDIFMVPGLTYEPFTNTGQCSATAVFSFLDTYYDGNYKDWYSDTLRGDVNFLFNGYGGFRQKANPMVIGSVNNNFISPSEFNVGGVSEAGVIGSHYFIPDVIDETTIAPNWGTLAPQPYTMVSMQDWRNSNNVYCKAIRKNAGLGGNYPDEDNGPRYPFVGQVYEANIIWPDMLSIGAKCNTYTTRVSVMTTTTTKTGPGTHLKNMLAAWGIQSKEKKCGCKSMQKKMDKGGPQWCRDHKTEILAHLEKEAKKRKLPFIKLAASKLIDLAIRRSERG